MKEIIIHTDGACSGNPGPGGWAAILEHKDTQKAVSGGVAHTTNNRMELQAAIEGLKSLNEPCRVVLFTDSSYLKDGISQWIHRWKKNGWRTAGKKPVKNRDLWEELSALSEKHSIDWRWLKGHDGHPLNEECDYLAREEISKITQPLT
jgi:ribonuclease HI